MHLNIIIEKMCIISLAVEEVCDTNIFVAVEELTQLTVYSNTVKNYTDNNAMVLPVPNPDSLKFIDLSKYPKIFDDLRDSFYEDSFDGVTFDGDNFGINGVLQVFNVGSYKVSVAMNLNDIMRVDKTVFTLSNGCYDVLKSNYGEPSTVPFGFIICKLVKGKDTYHPLAYSHTIISKDRVFIPTKHYHDNNETYTASNYDNSPKYMHTNQYGGSTEEWSHDIYLYNVKPNRDIMTMTSGDYVLYENQVKFNMIDFNFGQMRCFEKYHITGQQSNIDLYGAVC